MSENTETTQPSKAAKPENNPPAPMEEAQASTQEVKAKPKKKLWARIGSFFLNLLIFLVIIGLGVFGGYQSGIGIRTRAQTELEQQQLSDQFSRALVDIQFGNYDAARTRLEYIIENNPSFPGAMEKLTEVMVLTTIPTATPVVSPTPELIVDETDYEGLLAQAKQLVAAQQWENALFVLDTLRRKDATFHTVEVDGMYYYSLRNLGVDFIQVGNLEGGIYELTLAERFAPLDATAYALRDNARFYINAASFWELDWQRTAESFAQLNGSGIWDGTMTATERYRIATIRYAEELYGEEKYCAAYEQYQNAENAGGLDEESQGKSYQAYLACYPPTDVPQPTLEATTTTDPSVVIPTNTPEPTATTEPTAETTTP